MVSRKKVITNDHGNYFFSSRFLNPLDFPYFKSVAVLMHDISNNLSPPNIANLFISKASIHIEQGHLQEVTTLLNPQDLTNKFNPFQEMV